MWKTQKIYLVTILTIIWLVRIFQHLEVFHELLEVGGKVLQKETVVVLLLHQTNLVAYCHTSSLTYLPKYPNYSDLLLILDLPPRQLSVGKLNQHVEQRPQVVVASCNIFPQNQHPHNKKCSD